MTRRGPSAGSRSNRTSIWARVREMGSALDHALPSHIRNEPLRLALVRGDVFTIVWWATAMSKAATELAAMRTFLGPRNAETLAKDQAFVKARNKLSEALGSVVATTQARFDDPWDVIAMDAAASRLGTLESTIISTRFAARYVEAEVAAVAAAIAPVSRGARSTRAGGPAAAERTSRPNTDERDWTAEERDVFAGHVINLRKGKLSSEGSFSSTSEQVERIFGELIPAYAAALKAKGITPRVMFYAHGGLVEEREGLQAVLARRRFWELNGVYPVYFVWETGLRETLRDIVGGATRSARTARGGFADPAIETLARPGGKRVWAQMKKSAESAVATDGGARLAAELAGKLWKALKGDVEFHALGHSAGAIFHSHFLPLLVAQRPAGVPQVSVRTLHMLAPAVTTDLFKERLKPLIGSGKPITALTTYTMTDELERDDSSVKPYGKSLLYLVSGAFEDAVATKILGLQKSLKQDVQLIRFFGLAGTEKVADIAFSKTAAGVPLTARSESIRHGGFDNDVATMTSVVRRVLDVPDTTAVVDYFEESIPGIDRAAVGAVRSARVTPPEQAPRSITRIPSRAPAVRAAGARKKWTVMVWMAGDNDLEEFGDKDLAEMKRVGSNDDINIVVQFDQHARRQHAPLLRALRRRARRRCRPGARRDQHRRSAGGDRLLQVGDRSLSCRSIAGRDLEPWRRHRRHGRLSVGAAARATGRKRRQRPRTRATSPLEPSSSGPVPVNRRAGDPRPRDRVRRHVEGLSRQRRAEEGARRGEAADGARARRARLRRLPHEHDRSRLSAAGHRAASSSAPRSSSPARAGRTTAC